MLADKPKLLPGLPPCFANDFLGFRFCFSFGGERGRGGEGTPNPQEANIFIYLLHSILANVTELAYKDVASVRHMEEI